MSKLVRFADTNGDDVEARGYDTREGGSEVGRSWIYIVCPFCGVSTRAYLWSLAGGGKRCECGALFGSTGNAYQWVKP